MKKFLRIAARVLLVGGLIVFMGFINHNHNEEKCKEIVVEIEDIDRFGFIDENDIVEILNREFNTPISQKLKYIDTYEIEKRIDQHNAIDKSDVFITIDSKLHVKLKQRKPVLRVFTNHESFYIDNNGRPMPLSSKFTAMVPVANGNIHLSYKSLSQQVNNESIKIDSAALPLQFIDLVKLSQYIDNHDFWRAQIEQVYVNKESEFELIPRVGNHTIVLGGVDNLETKFKKLMNFYKHGLSKTGWNEYKTINLKFNNQVVCTKRN